MVAAIMPSIFLPKIQLTFLLAPALLSRDISVRYSLVFILFLKNQFPKIIKIIIRIKYS